MRFDRARLSSIRVKAMAVIVALTGAMVVFLVTYFPARQIDAMQGALRDKAAAYAHLVADQVQSGVAFDDRETVREVFTATSRDHDVRGLALSDATGRVIFSLGEFAGSASPPYYGKVDRVRLARGSGYLRAVAPVASREGPTGTLVLELSTDRLEAERRTAQRTALIVGLGALAFGFSAAWLVARSLGRRLAVIAGATRAVAAGDLAAQPVSDPSADEVGQLARSFNAMLANLRSLVAHIRETAERENERLDALVKERTTELDGRNRDMRLVLDNVDQGLLVVDREGRVLGEMSATAERWFGASAAGTPFADLLARVDRTLPAAFSVAWEQLVDGVLPVEVSLATLPATAAGAGREYELRYTILTEGQGPGFLLVVMSDVTERRRSERAEAEEREVACVFERAMRDRTGFREFLDETQGMIARLCGDDRPPLAEVKRALHTIKGNASLVGLGRLAGLAHELEDVLAERGADLEPALRAKLRTHWDALGHRLGALLGERRHDALTVTDEQYDAVLQGLVEGRSRKDVARMVASWRLEPTDDRFDRIGEQARALAARLGEEVVVRSDASGLRLSPRAMTAFWASFTHAVRNAISHGIESPEERVAAGKPAAGQIGLRAFRSGDALVIEISDDGRGIDWEAVRAKATAAGLPARTQRELHDALFHDGLSTRAHVDAVSGRGVGMGALRAECERLGGRMGVVSARGRGTTVTFSLPADRVTETDDTRAARAAMAGPSSRGRVSRSTQGSAPSVDRATQRAPHRT